ncbi:Eco57I restriction-modification methylase domain-containing protein, partial [Acidiphilium sp.]|uniref:Eco57I restriction-modification methylase domain-containing protein n=1 Tax=Acidiphilium sp. TaxID=527 RepID=UPI003D075944
MTEFENSFITKSFLRSVWANDYAAFKDSPTEIALIDRLKRWAARGDLRETSSEAAFIEEFFRATWHYIQDGQQPAGEGYTLHPKLALPGAGADGGTGEADLAIGDFHTDKKPIPQALCEFKGIKTDLDAPQKRKGKRGDRSPVRQCLDYLSAARLKMFGNEPVLPLWGIVTDMNRFRLYWHDRGPSQYADFIIRPLDILDGPGLLANTEAARFDRFLFFRLFHHDTLIATSGRPILFDLIRDQGTRDRLIETEFYREYRALRESLYTEILAHNGPGTPRYPGTHGRLVRLAQKLLDRLLFAFFCEDMGQVLAFPPRLIRKILTDVSNVAYFDPDAQTIWPTFRRLFKTMNEGGAFGDMPIRQFNGGLFAPDPALDALEIHDGIFCQRYQGQNEASIATHPRTILYLCARYSFAADLGDSAEQGDTKALGLYMLGRIFEQSITELEILEAEADGQPSINKISQRKRDGVYYTPEWVVTRIVELTFEPRLAALRADAGFKEENPTRAALDAYRSRLQNITVLDPACGSGAFLITALRLLLREWRTLDLIAAQIGDNAHRRADLHDRARDLLSRNIFGIDINPASVEITQLALWLHTAKADSPLSNLDASIRCGNTLVGPDFYREMQHALYNDEERERVNAFDWRTAFPEIVERGGFDIVVGNPPYVKLQNFRAALPDVASYLRTGREVEGGQHYASTQTGNFDLYLPFIEKGIEMLKPEGKLGYIAPSLWTVNEYGAGLRTVIARHRNLDRWIDFKSFQVFEEATTYTALQFYTRAPSEGVRVFAAPDGIVPASPFAGVEPLAWNRVPFGERWL